MIANIGIIAIAIPFHWKVARIYPDRNDAIAVAAKTRLSLMPCILFFCLFCAYFAMIWLAPMKEKFHPIPSIMSALAKL